MNGLEVVTIPRQGFLARLIGQKTTENAFLEILNLVASLPIYHVSHDAISTILKKYDTTREQGKSWLLSIYSQVLAHFAGDHHLTDDEVDQLRHLAKLFGLTKEATSQIHTTIVYPLYEQAVQAALEDHKLTEEESDELDKLAKQLHISEQEVKALYGKYAAPIYKKALDEAIADGLLSPQEEKRLDELANSLNLTPMFNAESEAAMDRYRLRWRISQGEIPRISVPIYLQKDESCAAFIEALHYEPSTSTRYVTYSKASVSQNVFGVSFRSGFSKGERITKNILRLRDVGILYFTNKRFLFNGSGKTTQIPLGKVIGITFYSDGMAIEKETGKDQIFTFNGDTVMLRLISDNLMSAFRQAQPTEPRKRAVSPKSRSQQQQPAKEAVTYKSPHEVLQINVGASSGEIKEAYRRLVVMYHPDKVASLAPEYREIAERRMKEINAAYAALTK